MLNDLAEHGIAAPLHGAGVAVAFAIADPADAYPPVLAEGGRLHHGQGPVTECVNGRSQPGTERPPRHAVVGPPIQAEDQVVPAIPLEPVGALGDAVVAGTAVRNEHGAVQRPVLQIGRVHVEQAAAPVLKREVGDPARHQHLVAPGLKLEDQRIAEVNGGVAPGG